MDDAAELQAFDAKIDGLGQVDVFHSNCECPLVDYFLKAIAG